MLSFNLRGLFINNKVCLFVTLEVESEVTTSAWVAFWYGLLAKQLQISCISVANIWTLLKMFKIIKLSADCKIIDLFLTVRNILAVDIHPRFVMCLGLMQRVTLKCGIRRGSSSMAVKTFMTNLAQANHLYSKTIWLLQSMCKFVRTEDPR